MIGIITSFLFLALGILILLPFWLGVGAGMEGEWGLMIALIAIGVGLILLVKAIGGF